MISLANARPSHFPMREAVREAAWEAVREAACEALYEAACEALCEAACEALCEAAMIPPAFLRRFPRLVWSPSRRLIRAAPPRRPGAGRREGGSDDIQAISGF
jgi:hypothetical protein